MRVAGANCRRCHKDLEARKWVKSLGWGNVDEAKKLTVEGIERARAGTPAT